MSAESWTALGIVVAIIIAIVTFVLMRKYGPDHHADSRKTVFEALDSIEKIARSLSMGTLVFTGDAAYEKLEVALSQVMSVGSRVPKWEAKLEVLASQLRLVLVLAQGYEIDDIVWRFERAIKEPTPADLSKIVEMIRQVSAKTAVQISLADPLTRIAREVRKAVRH